ncbi:hypothetical protein [Bacillus massiliglaciei]|uniref:hypothetical protein n=1 Tax=Bacillus massiliglaciei TaxID=1816693 RepID=UPI0018FE4FCD|nr:hypothetical protein [Bacillus massiliglaciei]
MKKHAILLCIMPVSLFMLAGCGGTADKKEAEPEKMESVSEKAPEVRAGEHNLTYTKTGESIEDTAFLKTSDNQSFSMYVLPEFELSSEEPGQDIVYLKKDERIFMRIEIVPEDANWTELAENAKSELQSSSQSLIDPGLNIDNGSSFEAKSEEGSVTSILLKEPNHPAKITIYSTGESDYRDAFLEMAKTINKQK